MKVISHIKYPMANLQRGFTLIELLAVVIVISTVGVIVVSIVVSSLRGSNKTNAITVTRQNGAYAIGQIGKMLRFAQSVDAIDGDSTINCVPSNPTPWPGSQPTLTAHSSITFTAVDGGQTTLACIPLTVGQPPYPMTIASNGASLLDTSAVQIPAGSCTITCDQTTTSDALLVGVHFSLNTAILQGTTLFPEFSAAINPIDFNTSIILRNVGR